MNLRELLEPNWVAKGSVCDLPLEVFADLNIKALVLDVDCTLLPQHSQEIPADVLVWLNKARHQWRLHLFSNNPNRRRIEAIANAFDLPFTAGAGKPRRGPLRLVLNQLKLPAAQVALIGDRVFTDVLAGNRLGYSQFWYMPLAVMVNRAIKTLCNAANVHWHAGWWPGWIRDCRIRDCRTDESHLGGESGHQFVTGQ